MYPSGELTRLSDRKTLLRARIAVRRYEMAAAAAAIARPIATVDRGLQLWQRIAPFLKLAAVPLGLILPRILARRRRGKPMGRSKLKTVMAVLPLIIRGWKLLNQVRTASAVRKAHAQVAAAPSDTRP